ncbi:hypothetical protein SKAU_G00076160 [Synaphobranchus kaupii]|uniref:Translation elongation factor EF1B beta/delta subunit guanine nucleotide exchange domain-containing protein n=1 Tax=Synaphobranchus kaupii TaxID=118154 RepID=A0A9Q1G883_SYNKA|nr:hypothetical protein SKAU_G00076160 [Synaphobranchus kaupii]
MRRPCLRRWDDETDMSKLEECVRSVQADGLLWGSSKLVPVGYGIKKLQIQCVVEDDKVGTDMLEEEITKFEDYLLITMMMTVTNKELSSENAHRVLSNSCPTNEAVKNRSLCVLWLQLLCSLWW